MIPKKRKKKGDLRIFCLGPGVGESIVLQLPDDSWGVVDCFQTTGAVNGTLDFLKAQKVNDLLFFCQTHPHEDHFLGSDILIKTFSGRIKNLWRHPGFSSRDILAKALLAAKLKSVITKDPEADKIQKEYARFLTALSEEQKHIAPENYRRISGSISLLKKRNFEIASIGPQAGVLDKAETKISQMLVAAGFLILNDDEGSVLNNLSVTLHIKFKETDIFLLADAQGKNLHIHPDKRNCAVVKVAHHGSSNGIACNRLFSVPKEYKVKKAIITPFRRCGLPTTSMVKKYKESCSDVIVTSENFKKVAPNLVLGAPSAQSIYSSVGWVCIEITSSGIVKDIEI
jgi:beta-lactamase superfamily II metal-dependent hydrolase